MTINNDLILDYVKNHTSPEPALLSELRRETWQKVLNPRMISGHVQGRLLAFISLLKQPKNILEIGTFTGYSTLCLAEGLPEDGKIITIDKNEELQAIQEKFFKKSKYYNKITAIKGDAKLVIPKLPETFDLVFIDGKKTEYKSYFDLILPKLNKNGILLVDNTLWQGKVFYPNLHTDEETQSIIAFNSFIKTNKSIDKVLLPFRDGLYLCIKK